MIQAGLNVILNAVQVMEPGGTITVTSRKETDADGRAVRTICFADTGPGIPEAAKGKLFDPFFTLRKDGTGLGLAIVHKILQDHGGGVKVGDNQPRGAKITFTLPAE
jgi:two-component system sensor histidine kinase HydH